MPTVYTSFAQMMGVKILPWEKGPLFTFTWERGIKNIFSSNISYERWESDAQWKIRMPGLRLLSLRAGYGTYSHREQNYFVDFDNFQETNLPDGWDDDWTGDFQLLNGSEFNRSNYYIRANATYESPLMIASWLPYVGKYIEKERFYINSVLLERSRPYLKWVMVSPTDTFPLQVLPVSKTLIFNVSVSSSISRSSDVGNHSLDMSKPLTIYKASAGSGKTFTLATEYIKLVVEDPQSYRNILAVTFTNKATEEMKMRILSQLYGIWKQLPDSANYMRVICAKTGQQEAFVSERAGMALRNLLHNYNYFRVETIDTFFQGVLRNLARELDLTANLRIGLNDTQVEELAVDQMIEDLHTTDVMLQWLMKYIMENISDDKSWNVIGQIKSFGKTIFK